MRKLGIALLALGLCAMAMPALALPHATEVTTDQPGVALRSPECLGDVVWDTGMNDTWVRPAGGFSAKLAMCFNNAIDPYGYAGYEYRQADDWVSDYRPITGAKIWSTMYNCLYYEGGITNLHGFCIKFYEAVDDPPYCPDGTVAGEDVIGTLVYDAYSADFTQYTVIANNKYTHCIQFPAPFQPAIEGHAYWAAITADFDMGNMLDPNDPNFVWNLFYWRIYHGGEPYSPFCEAVQWPLPGWAGYGYWAPTSGTYQIMHGTGMGYKLYDNFVFPNGACCDPTGACTVTIQHDCFAPSIWHGEWTDCSVALCPIPPAPGACCDPLGNCTYVLEAECLAPSIWHADVDCQTFACPLPVGACCDFATGNCTVVLAADCLFTWLGPLTVCTPENCPVPPPEGACCDRLTGNCAMTTELQCGFEWLGAGVVCSVTTCPPPPPPTGACCNTATGACSITTAADCTYSWLGAGSPCNAQTCPVPVPVEHKTWGGVKNSYR